MQDPRSRFDTIVGLEVHAQLLTESKMFCSCGARYADDAPNTHVCPVCLGMPGVLPVINRRAVEFTVMTALALNCTIPGRTKFDRKNYSYPDLMKGYQISQYDEPVGVRGFLDIEAEGVCRRIGITRVHLEEDVAKLTHTASSWGEAYSLIDVNRPGVPLMEIVSEPDIRSPEEARCYLVKLRSILCCLGVSTGNMEEGSFRCDANISVRPKGTTDFMPKVEIKNLNSFKSVFLALDHEARRQADLVGGGGLAVQETRGWNDEKAETFVQRSKEYAHDYRYFPEPDLPPLVVGCDWVERIQSRIPELPDAKRERVIKDYGLSAYDASLIVTSGEMAELFEKSVALLGSGGEGRKSAKVVANWLLGDFSRLLNASGIDIGKSPVTPAHLAELITLLEKGAINGPSAKVVFEEMFRSGKKAAAIVSEKGLVQITDGSEIEGIVAQVLAANASAVSDYRSGKQQAMTFLLGQVMKASRGRASPQAARTTILAKLDEKT